MSHEPDTDDPGEVISGLPVPVARHHDLEPLTSPVPVASIQAAALAATGFVAGAATALVVARRGRRHLTLAGPRRKRRLGRRRRKAGIGEIVSSNSFLVDVHLIRRD